MAYGLITVFIQDRFLWAPLQVEFSAQMKMMPIIATGATSSLVPGDGNRKAHGKT